MVLRSVAVAALTAAWAVGYRAPQAAFDTYANRKPLVERWDGTRWQLDHVSGSGDGGAWLDGVVAVSPDDAWAVGGQLVPTRRVVGRQRPLAKTQLVFRSLIEHWDGGSWRVVPSPNIGALALTLPRNGGIVPASSNELMSVAAVSPTDIWAVGAYGLPRAKSPPVERASYRMRFWPLTEHWTGVKWTIGPHVPWSVAPDSQLPLGFTVVGAAPPDDVLAVAPLEGEVWRLNGTAWEQSSQAPQFAQGLVVIAHDDAWIIGPQPVAYHWDGQTWQPSQLPAAGLVDAVSADATDDVWAVGRLSPTGTKSPLVGDNNVLLHFAC